MRWPVRRGLLSSIWAPATTENEETKLWKGLNHQEWGFTWPCFPHTTFSWFLLSLTAVMNKPSKRISVIDEKCGIKCLGSLNTNAHLTFSTYLKSKWQPTDWVPFVRSDLTESIINYKKYLKTHTCRVDFSNLPYWLRIYVPTESMGQQFSKSDVSNHKSMRKHTLSWCKLQIAF